MNLLPKLTVPTYELKLSNGTTIEYRPFLVKEEKILLLDLQSDDPNAYIKSVLKLVESCTFGKIDPKKQLSFTDLLYLLINIRAKSVGETAKFQLPCNKEGCTNKIDCSVDLTKIKPNIPAIKDTKVSLTSDVGVILKAPSVEVFVKYNYNDNPEEQYTPFDIIVDCIDSVYTKEELLSAKDYKREQLQEFVESFSHEQMQKVNEIFNNFPVISHVENVKCQCGNEMAINFNKIEDFFV